MCSPVLFLLIPNIIQVSRQNILLESLLPSDPLQPPETWAWGKLVNGNVYIADQNFGGELPESASREPGRERKKLEGQEPMKEERTEQVGPELAVAAADI